MKTYKDLIFWQRAFEVTKSCILLVRKFPKETIAFIIADQLLRASASIGANISEGYGRFGSKEYVRFLRMALSSGNETEYWLLLLKDTYPEFSSDVDNILAKNSETIKMLTASINRIRNKQ